MTDRAITRPATLLTHGGRPTAGDGPRPVNPPVVRTSTVLYPNVRTMAETKRRRAAGERILAYGRRGTPTTFALEEVLAELEQGAGAKLFCSGLAAIALTFASFLKPGDHVLIIDSCYEPVRRLCAGRLAPQGIAYDFFRPDLDDIEAKIKPSTRLIWAECPGSLVYEMLDLPALAAFARPRGIPVAVDNTWGSGLLYQPLALGADLSVIAGTKYITGHSDVMLGAVVANERCWPALAETADLFGQTVGGDDAALALRGLRTLHARLPLHQANAMLIARWAATRPEIARVHYPALSDHPGHALWRRDFSGACGLLTLEFRHVDRQSVEGFVDRLVLFGIGSSWGGYESLALPVDPGPARSETDWSGRGPMVRLHAGLEDGDDLIADLAQAIDATLASGG